MCGEGMFEWPRTEGPALALELLASEAAAAALHCGLSTPSGERLHAARRPNE